MHSYAPCLQNLALLAAAASSIIQRTAAGSSNEYHVRPFYIDLSEGVPRMLDLVQSTQLPKEPEYAGLGDTAGIDLDVLKGLQEQWLTTFDWNREQQSLNSFKHYTAVIENLTIHFIHEKSSEPDAIPLILKLMMSHEKFKRMCRRTTEHPTYSITTVGYFIFTQ